MGRMMFPDSRPSECRITELFKLDFKDQLVQPHLGLPLNKVISYIDGYHCALISRSEQ